MNEGLGGGVQELRTGEAVKLMAEAGWVDNTEVRIISVGYCSSRELAWHVNGQRNWLLSTAEMLIYW